MKSHIKDLLFILEQIHRMLHIPVYYTNAQKAEPLLNLGYTPEENPFISDPLLYSDIIFKLQNASEPVLILEEDVIYGACSDPFGNSIILGPFSNKKLSAPYLKHYTYQHKIKAESFYIMTQTLGEFCAALVTLYFTMTGKQLQEGDLLSTIATPSSPQKKGALRYTVDPPKEGPRFNYSTELDFIKPIKDGRPEEIPPRINRNFAIFLNDSVGKLAESSFKQNEYMACTALALASRAAIDGGLNAFVSYSMSDLYLQRLERCLNVLEIYQLINEFTLEYAQQVKRAKEDRSKISYVEQCKTYIVNHLNQRFTVEDIAYELKINRFYLSRQFTHSEGIGIQQYTKRKRIEAASNMLKFSDENLLTISDYFCFASQSHFGKAFKEQLGMTPQKYRNKNKVIDFVQ